MQKYLFIVLTLLTLLFLVSCDRNNDPDAGSNEVGEFLIIGLTFGECGGDCAHFYKLESNELFVDDEQGWWNGADINFVHQPVNNESALSDMEMLNSDFPSYLIDTEEISFGCPDCGDWGAIHVLKLVDGEMKGWTLDNQVESNPEEIQDWTSRVQSLLFELIN